MVSEAQPEGRLARAIYWARWRILQFTLLALLCAALLGVAWAVLAPRPSYVVGDQYSATIAERSLAAIFGVDALFSLFMLVFGLVVGISCWFWFRQLGWFICLLAILVSGLGAVIAWQLGSLVGISDFDTRLAEAAIGDEVPIDLALRSLSSLLVAPFAAVTPIMMLAAFWPEHTDKSAAPDQQATTGEAPDQGQSNQQSQ